jgi:excisionase family DNA binding protein
MEMKGKPLFTLTIEEFIALTKELVEEVLGQKQNEQTEKQDQQDECFDISGLAEFLHCSKVSIHNYKKKGMPFYRIGRKLLFKKSEVLKFMKGLRPSKRFI